MIKNKECIEESYIYFATRFDTNYCKSLTERKLSWMARGYDETTVLRWIRGEKEIKIGETASFKNRLNHLYYNDGISIRRYVKFEGTKEERLFLESYVRSKYASNANMTHFGNDYFQCANINTIKGAQNKFFSYIAEGFELLSQIKHKNYNYTCEMC